MVKEGNGDCGGLLCMYFFVVVNGFVERWCTLSIYIFFFSLSLSSGMFLSFIIDRDKHFFEESFDV